METLQYLSPRHHLILMTKGAIVEQTGKIERSGLKEYFAATEIVAEKDAAAYHQIVEKYELEFRLHMDGRQQSEVGHQSRAGRRIACRIRSARQHVGSRT